MSQSAAMTAADIDQIIRATIHATWRVVQPRLIATLSRMLRDVPLAEELTQDALVAALEAWPAIGMPDNPGAWLMTTARRRALDHLRRGKMLSEKHDMLARDMLQEQEIVPDFDAALDDDIGDELLRLVFTACHPILSREARAALALRMICGLTTSEIARAYLVPEATISQRIVRAKRKLSGSGLAYETPSGEALSERLASVLEVVYLIFNEGYLAAHGDEWLRPQLCDEALRMGRVLAGLAPDEPEVHSLVALMDMNAARVCARTDASGDPILLMDQDRSLWDRSQIRRGLRSLERARELGGAGRFYALQAAIAACHVTAETAACTDWRRIAQLYAELALLVRSPIIELNRAVAVGMAFGPEQALSLVEGLADDPTLRSYHLLPAVRADLLEKLGRTDEAARDYALAASMTRNVPEQQLLLRRSERARSRQAGGQAPD
jgi:RNA polymerase sigma factor (sigma-70 family)